MKSLLLAGTQSGCGKTTVTLALLQYLQQQGRSLTTFKAGPDFLDPLWHQVVTQKVCRNLDTRMMGTDECLYLYNSVDDDIDVTITEGVMGMFDGREGVGGEGSSADLARVLDIPVCLIVDAKGMSGSIVPLVKGFVDQASSMGVTISGIIANRVGSEHHAGLLKNFLSDYNLPPLLAWMSKQAPGLPERHLGLMRPAEYPLPDFLPFIHVQDELLDAALAERKQVVASKKISTDSRLQGKHIAIARDEACCFCYQANIDWLQTQGAELSFFSPVKGEELPENSDALWLPGGYPELYAEALANSKSWSSVKAFIEKGKPVLAECGGMMLLGQSLKDKSEQTWSMAGVLPFKTRMQDRLAALGYRQCDSGIKGHEFHHSVRDDMETLATAFNPDRGDKGMQYKNVRASYVHWYFPSAPEVAASWFGGTV